MYIDRHRQGMYDMPIIIEPSSTKGSPMHSILAAIADTHAPMPCLFYPAVSQSGSTITATMRNAHLQSKVLQDISRRFHVPAVIRMSELWAEAAAFGMQCSFPGDDFPRLGPPLCPELDAMQELAVPQVRNAVTLPLINAAADAVLALHVPLIVGITGPYTLAAVLGGSTDFMMNCILEPDAVHIFLDRITEFLIAYAQEYLQAGVGGIMIAEPSASMISPAMSSEFSNPYVDRLAQAISSSQCAVIYHSCGPANPHLPNLAALQVDAFHFGNDVDLDKALAVLPPDAALMGNIDPRLFDTEDPAHIEKHAAQVIALAGHDDRFILSTGCDLSPRARIDSIQRFCSLDVSAIRAAG
jgi:uroporphyrinogen decarboxylase